MNRLPYTVALAMALVFALPAGAKAQDAERFLAGETLDCPGCDLAGANLKMRKLMGANLAGANLEGASFHRANLTGANLSGAILTGANLNKGDPAKRQLFRRQHGWRHAL